MTLVEPIEQNKKLEELSERKDGIEGRTSYLLEYIGTGKPNIFSYHGTIYAYFLGLHHGTCDSKIIRDIITELS